ncbi:fatty acid desaturase [Candidatus Saccharibacteria bacterium]|nr:fatty acid desaturase [Candidatus Saccharibacteria bacterium]
MHLTRFLKRGLNIRGVILLLLAKYLTTESAIYATTIYLHREMAHKSVTLSRPMRLAARLILWLTTGIIPRQWAAIHQQHHAHSDEPGDPHSPKLEGLDTVEWHNVRFYQQAGEWPDVKRREALLYHDRLDAVLLDKGGLGLAVGISIACLGLGPVPGAIVSLLHWPDYILRNASVNGLAHAAIDDISMQKQSHAAKRLQAFAWRHGYRSYETNDTSLNIPWLARLTAGEGYHNNHHYKPASPTFALKDGESDKGYRLIQLLARLHLATIREQKVAS